MAKADLLFRTPYGLLKAPGGGSPTVEQAKLIEHPWILQGENTGSPAAGKATSLVLPTGGRRKLAKGINFHPNSLRAILGTFPKSSSIDSNSESSVKQRLDDARSSVPAMALDLGTRLDSVASQRPRERISPPGGVQLERPKRRGGDQMPPASTHSSMRRSMSALTVDANCNVIDEGSSRRLKRSSSTGSIRTGSSFASMMRSAVEDGRSALSAPTCSEFAGQRRPHEEKLPHAGRNWFCTIKKLS